ncbi:MAG: tRNA (5-methylaminomethyl-2-thiouridine)(34)-methyltransferase MnmD [Bacteroidota bacterium]
MRNIITTGDGSHSIFSEIFGSTYHSKYGAIQESQHVFIDAALRIKAVIQQQIDLLEIGFGTGLNAYMTLLEAQKRNLDITYTAIEAFPISMENVRQLNYTQQIGTEADALLFEQMHLQDWGQRERLNEHFSLHKIQDNFENMSFVDQFDIIYFDAFAPNIQPHLWEEPLLQIMYDALREDGILTTYCAKGIFKRRLKSIGFVVESIPGPPGKREMTRASK